MEQFESLLTCCVCLDRYRNPKLLPCQHSFCMEPCMDGLVDYVRRQVKCPECRAEHRIPYQGVQGFPTNVTLQRFLELHQAISGELPDPTAGQVMERCNVCSEKAYCGPCAHCDKKICEDCKSAHMDILRREISRINNQVRRGVHRLQDILAIVERNSIGLQTNCTVVMEEIDEIHRRLAKALKDRTEFLRSEVDRYLGTELRNLTNLKENLELELANITSNCDLADKYMNEDVDWEDTELVDTKEIFLKTVEFLRNFDYEAGDYGRRVRFVMTHDPNQLVLHVASYAELNINTPPVGFGPGLNTIQPQLPGLSRSKSDHRLATQFRQQEESRGYNEPDEPVLGGRRFGERRPQQQERHRTDYGGEEHSGYENDSRPSRRFRSRFVKSHQRDVESDNEQPERTIRDPSQKEKEKVIDTEDTSRGPLSGIFRLADSPRVMLKLQEATSGKKKEKKEPPVQPKPVQATPQTPKKQPPPSPKQPEDDEISKIKRQNKGGPSQETTPRQDKDDRNSASRKAPAAQREASSEGETEDDSINAIQRTQRKTPAAPKAPVAAPRRTSNTSENAPATRTGPRSASTDSSGSSETTGIKHTGAICSIAELKQKYDKTVQPATRLSSAGAEKVLPPAAGNQRYPGRFPGSNRTTPAPTETPKEDDAEETETSSEEETDSSEESEEEAPQPPRKKESQAMARSDIGPLLARSSNARDAAQETTKKEPAAATRYRTRPQSQEEPETASSRYNSNHNNGPSYTNRYTPKSRDDETHSSIDDESKYPTARSRYLAMKERRNRLARSKSTHSTFGAVDDDDADDPVSSTTTSPSAYLASRYGTGSELSRSRSTHALKSRENSPERITAPTDKDGTALSSWARYLKSKYGGRSGKDREPATSTSSTAARRISLGLPLRSSTELASSDDDSKNAAGSPISPMAATAAVAGIAGSSPRSQYLQKRRLLFKVGSRGSEPGYFTWPRGIAVGPDNSIVIADSSNHRVQVFDSNGVFVKEFGGYGNGQGEFDCLAGVSVNRIGQYIIADRYNHRIQVFDPSGRFLRSFGSQGTGDGKFNYPWGITTDALGFIYVCDKENHRVQVFQSDGTFVGKFGTMGSKAGQLEHPHYIAVSNTNRVLVSDSNNHRVQVFDVNGKVLSSFGEEGSDEGQFKFPRGVAVDDQGYIVVADSGNNRIQIFNPDGSFLRAFGSWGSSDGEFKGLEGIAVMSNGNIIVCDRENHRLQVF